MKRSVALAAVCLFGCIFDVSGAAAKEPNPDDALGVIRIPSIQKGSTAPVATVTTIHPNGELVAAVGDDHVIRFWNLKTGTPIGKSLQHQDRIHAMKFDPQGQRLVTGGNDRQLFVWDMLNGRVLHRIAFDQAVASVAFSNNGKWIAVGGFEKKLWIFDARTLQASRTLAAPCRDIRCVTFSKDDLVLASGGRNGVIQILDIESGRSREFKAHKKRIRSMEFSSDLRLLLTAGEDCEIKAWNTANYELEFQLDSDGKVLSLVAMGTPYLATGGTDNCVSIWDLETRTRIDQLRGHTGSVVSLDYRDGTLLSGAFDNTIRIWRSRSSLNTKITRN